MVTPECLAALDHLLWLQTGQRAAEALSCDQSTISRTSRKALATFELQLKRQQGSWQLSGDHTLLNLERRVHQQLRWSTGGRLRLDGHPACRAASCCYRTGPSVRSSRRSATTRCCGCNRA